MDDPNSVETKELEFNAFLSAYRTLCQLSGAGRDTLVFPLPIMQIAPMMGFELIPMPGLRDKSRLQAINQPIAVVSLEKRAIYVPDEGSTFGLNFTLAHEMAHVLRNVVCTFDSAAYDTDLERIKASNHIEHRTNLLAYELLMPDFFFKHLAGMNHITAVAEYFRVSHFHVMQHAVELRPEEIQLAYFSKTSGSRPFAIIERMMARTHGEALQYSLRRHFTPPDHPQRDDTRPTETMLMVIDSEGDRRVQYLTVGELIEKQYCYHFYNIYGQLEELADDSACDHYQAFLRFQQPEFNKLIHWIRLPLWADPAAHENPSMWVVILPWQAKNEPGEAHALFPDWKVPQWTEEENIWHTRKWLNKIRHMLGLRPRDYPFKFMNQSGGWKMGEVLFPNSVTKSRARQAMGTSADLLLKVEGERYSFIPHTDTSEGNGRAGLESLFEEPQP